MQLPETLWEPDNQEDTDEDEDDDYEEDPEDDDSLPDLCSLSEDDGSEYDKDEASIEDVLEERTSGPNKEPVRWIKPCRC